MKTKTLKNALTAGSLLALLAGVAMGQERVNAPSNALSTRYVIQDLGVVGSVEGQPFVLTANEYVAGLAVVPGGSGSSAAVSHAVYWYGTSMKDISYPGLAGPNNTAFGINVWGQIVGEAENATPDPNGEDFCGFQSLGFTSQANSCLPYLFQNGQMIALPTLRDDFGKSGVNGQAWQINTFGVAVGSSENTTSDTCPLASQQKFQFKPVAWFKLFPWSEEHIHELRTVSGDPDGVAVAVNERGDAAGASGTCGPFNSINLFNLVPRHAILWQYGKPIDLGNLGGDGLFGGIFASGLNNVGQVVGLSDTTNDASFHAFLWENGHMTDLQTLPGDSYSTATAISDRGVVTGVSIDANFNIRALVWQQGNMQDLNNLVSGSTTLYLQTACSINARGEIDGIAQDKVTGEYHAYKAIPQNTDSD